MLPDRHYARLICLLMLLLSGAALLSARVVRVEVNSHQDVLHGQSFGDAGAYEFLTGRVYFSVKIADLHNANIVDLKNAVNLKNGVVEFSSDFIAIRPKDPKKS